MGAPCALGTCYAKIPVEVNAPLLRHFPLSSTKKQHIQYMSQYGGVYLKKKRSMGTPTYVDVPFSL